MAKLQSGEDVLQLSGFVRKSDTWQNNLKTRFPSYQVSLLLHDLIAVMLAFGISFWIFGVSFFPSENSVSFLVMVLVAISFFPTYHLYSYHFIFSSKNHLLNTIKAFGWSLFTLGFILLLSTYSYLLEGRYVALSLFATALALLLLSRYLWDEPLYLLKSVGMGFLVLGIMGYIMPDERPVMVEHWPAVLVGFSLAVGIILVSRSLLVNVVFNNWLRRYFRKQVAIIGSDKEAKSITSHIINHNAPFWVTGFVGSQADRELDASVSKTQLGELKNLPLIVKQKHIDEIIVTDEEIAKPELISILDYCTSEGITVWFSPKLMPIIDLKLYIDVFCGIKMIRLSSQKNSYIFDKIKYGLDALFVLPMLMLLSPIFLAIGLAIKIDSRGPVFYRARAIGKSGHTFSMYKFRSMSNDTGNEIHKEYVTKLINGKPAEENEQSGVFKMTNDKRITLVGKFLRKLSLDELPQLINVLKGDMSLVGPRPCLPYEYEVYKDWHKKRLSIRPGITGVWQVTGRSTVSFEDMVLLDLYYIYNRNLIMDINILYETTFVVLGKRGAY